MLYRTSVGVKNLLKYNATEAKKRINIKRKEFENPIGHVLWLYYVETIPN